MIKLAYMIECRDEYVAAKVQDEIELDNLIAVDGVSAISAQWIVERNGLTGAAEVIDWREPDGGAGRI